MHVGAASGGCRWGELFPPMPLPQAGATSPAMVAAAVEGGRRQTGTGVATRMVQGHPASREYRSSAAPRVGVATATTTANRRHERRRGGCPLCRGDAQNGWVRRAAYGRAAQPVSCGRSAPPHRPWPVRGGQHPWRPTHRAAHGMRGSPPRPRPKKDRNDTEVPWAAPFPSPSAGCFSCTVRRARVAARRRHGFPVARPLPGFAGNTTPTRGRRSQAATGPALGCERPPMTTLARPPGEPSRPCATLFAVLTTTHLPPRCTTSRVAADAHHQPGRRRHAPPAGSPPPVWRPRACRAGPYCLMTDAGREGGGAAGRRRLLQAPRGGRLGPPAGPTPVSPAGPPGVKQDPRAARERPRPPVARQLGCAVPAASVSQTQPRGRRARMPAAGTLAASGGPRRRGNPGGRAGGRFNGGDRR